VIEHSSVIEEFAGFFRRIFSWHGFRRFKQYLTDLLPGRNQSVRSIASRQIEPVD